MPFSIFVNKTLYQKIKNEEHREKGKVVQIIIQTFSLVQCLCYPSILLCVGLLKFSLDYLKLLGLADARYLITSVTFSISLLRDYLAFHSLIISIARFTFIAFDSTAEKFGIQRIRKIVIALSITIPLVSTVLYDATTPIEATATVFDAFYYNPISSNETNQTLENTYGDINLAIQSPLYCLVNTYFPRSIVSSMKIVEKILFILIYSNVIEAILYARIMTISKRYYSRLILSLLNVKIK